MSEPTVNDVMTRCPVAVRAGASFEEIVNLLAGNKVSAVPVLAVPPHGPVSAAVTRLAKAGVRRLFVVDNGRLVGMLSRRDLLRGYLREDADIGRVEWRSERAVVEAPIRMVRGTAKHTAGRLH